jgi:hypothetical protein
MPRRQSILSHQPSPGQEAGKLAGASLDGKGANSDGRNCQEGVVPKGEHRDHKVGFPGFHGSASKSAPAVI